VMGILKRIGAMIGILAECFILIVPVAILSETIGTFNVKIATAYNSSYQEAYDSICHTRYQEGYDEQYEVGYAEQYEVGYNAHYTKAYDEGYESGLEIGYEQGLDTRVGLHNPTYRELLNFLRRDKTNSKPYIKGEYVCADFAADVNNNAELEGIRAAYVSLSFPLEGHAIVAFETTDKGLIFIEPQSDRVAKLVIGQSYWQSVGSSQARDYDDTVVEIQIIW